MKLPVRTTIPCLVVGKKAKEYEMNGNKGSSYSLAVICDGEAVNLPCSQQVYDKVGELGQYAQVTLFGDFDTNYKNFKATAVERVEVKK